jgi:hypothetical protein
MELADTGPSGRFPSGTMQTALYDQPERGAGRTDFFITGNMDSILCQARCINATLQNLDSVEQKLDVCAGYSER